jgi:dihydroorotase
VKFVLSAPDTVAATITAHHLLMNRNDIFSGGIRPHNYCLPILKREEHRQALIKAATSGNPKFFLGTDSAPHSRRSKETACGCAGIYTAHAALELYAEAFDAAGSLDKLEGLPAFTAPISTVSQEIGGALRSSRAPGWCQTKLTSGPTNSYRCAPGRS